MGGKFGMTVRAVSLVPKEVLPWHKQEGTFRLATSMLCLEGHKVISAT